RGSGIAARTDARTLVRRNPYEARGIQPAYCDRAIHHASFRLLPQRGRQEGCAGPADECIGGAEFQARAGLGEPGSLGADVSMAQVDPRILSLGIVVRDLEGSARADIHVRIAQEVKSNPP